jgi:SPP1 gp7 family putative phage head morphogenesis protein
MIDIEKRKEIIRKIESGEITSIQDLPILNDYYINLFNEYKGLVSGYNYDKKNDHIDYLKGFAMGKLATFILESNKKIEGLTDRENRLKQLTKQDELYNETFHETEVSDIAYQSKQAQDFQDLEGDGLPNFKYFTQRDDRVRPSHRQLDGIVLSKDNPFWEEYIPQNGYNCRCYVQSTSQEPTNNKKKIERVINQIKTEGIDKKWRFNPAKSNNLLEIDHPYLQNDNKELRDKFELRTLSKKVLKVENKSFSGYPQQMTDNAKKGIRLNEEVNNKCATRVGKIRARQLENREPLSFDTIKRMYSYLSRAETYYDPDDETACGTISYLLWGGKSAKSWTKKIIDQEDG